MEGVGTFPPHLVPPLSSPRPSVAIAPPATKRLQRCVSMTLGHLFPIISRDIPRGCLLSSIYRAIYPVS